MESLVLKNELFTYCILSNALKIFQLLFPIIFIVIGTTLTCIVSFSEGNYSAYSSSTNNPNFGTGSDNVLFTQNCQDEGEGDYNKSPLA